MTIPQNGRVVIIDDNWEEAKPIVKALGRKSVPILYFPAIDCCPDAPVDDIRIVFLDLRLLPGSSETKAAIGPAYAVFSKIISETNGPYILALWTKHIEEYDEFLAMIKKYNPAILPHWTIQLVKNDYIESKGANEWVEKQGAMDRLQEELAKIMVPHSALRALISWEACMHRSASGVVKELWALAKGESDVDNQLAALMALIGEANIGKQHFAKAPPEHQTAELFSVLTEVAIDILESDSLRCHHVLGIPSDPSPGDNLISAINSRLFFAGTVVQANTPGQLYSTIKKDIVERLLGQKLKAWQEELFDTDKIRIHTGTDAEKDEWRKNKLQDLREQSPLVFVEVSPNCDFAQKKRKLLRIVPGLWVNKEDYGIVRHDAQYLYTTPDIVGNAIGLDKSQGCVIFDLRGTSTFVEKQWSEIIEQFSLAATKKMRRSLLTEMQTRLASHMSRPGINSLRTSKR